MPWLAENHDLHKWTVSYYTSWQSFLLNQYLNLALFEGNAQILLEDYLNITPYIGLIRA